MKARPSKLDRFGERLEEWFLAGKTLAQAQELLAAEGCAVSLGRLSEWWSSRQSVLLEDRLLGQIASGARQCREVEAQFAENPAPEFETLIRLHRVLILKLSTQGNAEPEMLELVNQMMKPVVQFARLQQVQAQIKLDERRVKLLEEKAKLADQAKGVMEDKALSEEERAARMRELFGMG
jgi:hypothetical protein